MSRMVIAGLLAGWAGGAGAQTNEPAAVTAMSGELVRLGYYASFKADCSPGPLPEIHVTTPPRNGEVVIRQAKVRTRRIVNCPTVEGPVAIVFYRSQPGFTGSDAVAFTVRESNGRLRTATVAVTVTGRPRRGGPVDL